MKSMIGSNRAKYRPITLADFDQFYNVERPHGTVRGIAFFWDDALVAICGVKFLNGCFYVFSDIKEGVNISSQAIWRGAVLARNLMKKMNVDIYACPDPDIDRASVFLSRMGFIKKDDVYVLEAK